jgi:hypothetical protein
VAARGASAAFGGFGLALNTAATFDVFYWPQVTNYGVLYVLFDSAPSGSNDIDVWDLCLHAQTASPIISSQRFSDESRREQAEKLFDRVRKSCTRREWKCRECNPVQRSETQVVTRAAFILTPARLKFSLGNL